MYDFNRDKPEWLLKIFTDDWLEQNECEVIQALLVEYDKSKDPTNSTMYDCVSFISIHINNIWKSLKLSKYYNIYELFACVDQFFLHFYKKINYPLIFRFAHENILDVSLEKTLELKYPDIDIKYFKTKRTFNPEVVDDVLYFYILINLLNIKSSNIWMNKHPKFYDNLDLIIKYTDKLVKENISDLSYPNVRKSAVILRQCKKCIETNPTFKKYKRLNRS